MMESIEKVYSLLSSPKRIAITMHQKPDADAMGSSLGLKHFLVALGHEVTVISPTNWAHFLNWMPGVNQVLDYELSSHHPAVEQALNSADLLFCLDFNVLYRTKRMEPVLLALPCTKVLIDHHQQPAIDQFHFGVSDTSKSSTCEMIYDFIVHSGHRDLLSQSVMQCLYAGTMTDTGSFRFASTGADVHEMVADFKRRGLRHTDIHEHIYDSHLENRLRFVGHVLLNRMEVFYEYNAALIAISKADLIKFEVKTGDTEGLVNYPLSIQGIKFAALVIDREEERKWSFRSKGNFDVNTFARTHFEGGGHFNAAGGRSSLKLEDAVLQFKEVLKNYRDQLSDYQF